MGFVAPQHVGSSRTRDWTRVPWIGRQILNHCATREVWYISLICEKPEKIKVAQVSLDLQGVCMGESWWGVGSWVSYPGECSFQETLVCWGPGCLEPRALPVWEFRMSQYPNCIPYLFFHTLSAGQFDFFLKNNMLSGLKWHSCLFIYN